jgi:glycosyltransferase involved in cell wall biosynthesis
MSAPHLVSIIIDNYNYARFLPLAIESAVNQDYQPVEVIVVDDGSTDQSREILQGYAGRLIPILKENGGQASAFNAGFASSQGEIVIFLDSDDVLHPQTVSRIVAAFDSQPAPVRVSYRMRVVDGEGRWTGQMRPHQHLSVPSGDLRKEVMSFSFDIPWLPTSGNAFSRRVLEQVFPVPEQDYRILADYYLSHLVPLFGPVVFLDEVLADYRIHGGNSYDINQSQINLDHLRKTITHSQFTAGYINRYADRLELRDGSGGSSGVLAVSTVANRLISLKLDPASHPVKSDTIGGLVRLGFSAASRRFDLPFLSKIIFYPWFIAMAVAPRPLAQFLAEKFMFPEKRAELNQVLAALR